MSRRGLLVLPRREPPSRSPKQARSVSSPSRSPIQSPSPESRQDPVSRFEVRAVRILPPLPPISLASIDLLLVGGLHYISRHGRSESSPPHPLWDHRRSVWGPQQRIGEFSLGLSPLAAVRARRRPGGLTQEGSLIVSLKGARMCPLPARDSFAPVRCMSKGKSETVNEEAARAGRLAIALNSAGRLFSRRLPRCTAGQLQQTRVRTEALAVAPARRWIGRGHFEATVDFRP